MRFITPRTKFSGCLNYLTCAEGDTYETAFFLLYCPLLRFSFFVFMLCDAWIYTGFIQSQNNWLEKSVLSRRIALIA